MCSVHLQPQSSRKLRLMNVQRGCRLTGFALVTNLELFYQQATVNQRKYLHSLITLWRTVDQVSSFICLQIGDQ